MGLCVVMNRCAAVEGGAGGGEERVGERKEIGEEAVDEEELEVVCACVYWRDCGFSSSCAPYCWNCVVFTTKTLLLCPFAPLFGY